MMFDAFADIYEAMIDWPKRLAHEGPFYRRWFERVGVKSVLDTACGSGHHAAMFHSWGLNVEGADLSGQMIDLARSKFGEPPGLNWVVRGFDEPFAASKGTVPFSLTRKLGQSPEKTFDAAVCVGNSLALAPDSATIERAVRRMFEAVRGGGLVIIHLLNLWRLPDGPCVWQKCQKATLSQNEVLILKGVHRCGPRGYVELIVADLSGSAPLRSESTPLFGIEAPELERMTKEAGAKKVTLFGGYQDQPYERQASVDLVLVAEKG
jgi:SAM-dependent methyltransferase